MRIFSTYPVDNQSNWHKLALEGRTQGASVLTRTTRSWHTGQVVLIRSVLILSYRLRQYYVGGG